VGVPGSFLDRQAANLAAPVGDPLGRRTGNGTVRLAGAGVARGGGETARSLPPVLPASPRYRQRTTARRAATAPRCAALPRFLRWARVPSCGLKITGFRIHLPPPTTTMAGR